MDILKLLQFLLFNLLLNCALDIYADNKNSQQHQSKAHYLGNEGVLIEDGGTKILFDPFFHNDFGQLTLVPESIRNAIFQNISPFDNINAVFISHAHEDHFDKNDVVTYLKTNQHTKLIAPVQAVKLLMELHDFNAIKNQIITIDTQKGDTPQNITIEKLNIEAVNIPHSGWPKSADIKNIVYRVKLNKNTVVMHMGDADVNLSHFNEQQSFWGKHQTDIAFPPFWFFLDQQGNLILDNTIKAKQTIGVHVPNNVPGYLSKMEKDYFSIPGETRDIN